MPYTGDNIKFQSARGRESTARILSEEQIGHGSFGNVYETVLDIGGHRKRMAIKRFHDEGVSRDPEHEARIAMQNYETCKNAGLRVFPTCRLGRDERSILMTLGKADNLHVLGGDEKRSVGKINNLSHFLDQLVANAHVAAEKGICLPFDAYFFVVKTIDDKSSELDFVVGDFDGVSTGYKNSGKHDMVRVILLENLAGLASAIDSRLSVHLDMSLAESEIFEKLVYEKIRNVSE